VISSTNPATGELLETFEAVEPNALLDAAVFAQGNWRQTDVDRRTDLLLSLAEQLRKRRPELAALISTEMGKPLSESEAEIEKCAITCEYYATNAAAMLAPETVTEQSRIEYEPLGVVLAVMPWNFPFWQFFRFLAPALAAGNGAILKPADTVPRCALAIESVLRDAGVPDGLVGLALVETEQVAELVADDRIAAVTFTGSTRVGRIIASQAAQALKKQVLELGGSDPFVVLADADLEAAAATAVKARFLNAGQSCVNAKRLIVEEAVADEFVERFCAAVDHLVLGDPLDRRTTLGPLAREDLRDAVHDQVRRSVEAGAVLVRGGAKIDPGYYYHPTVLDQVRPGMAAFDEETFGPVAAIVRARDADEAIRLANRTEYGLGASLWTAPERSAELVRRIDAGAVFVNAMVASDPRLPFGGIKHSGYGRELGAHGMREFLNTKTVWSADPAPRLVVRPVDVEVFDRGSGVRTVPYVGAWNCVANRITTGTTTFAPGTEIPLHSHNVEESVLVFAGQATAVIDGERVDLEAGDATWVPAGVPHQFINRGAGEMTIYWVYGGRAVTRTMTATGVTVAHLSAADRGAVAAPMA
jgi:succinate-semialdehyde dehydrogenase/glutarate-semialdehyde dehydrogenase